MTSVNAQSSRMRKVELLSLWQRRTPRIWEARNPLQVTQQLWNGNDAQPCHWPLPHTASPLSVVLFHGVLKLCVIIRSSGFVFTYSPRSPLGSPTWGAFMTYMPPTTIAPTHATQTQQPGAQTIPIPFHPLHLGLGNSDSLFKICVLYQ